VPSREGIRPRPRRGWIEEIDDISLDRRLDLGCERVEALAVATAHARVRALLGEAAHDRRAEIPGSPCDCDYPTLERLRHGATLATSQQAE